MTSPQKAAPNSLNTQPTAADGKPRILVVDDEDMIRLVIRTLLTSRGYQVTEAVDGEDAVRQYAGSAPPFDFVLLDLHMPRMNGFDVVLRIRELNPYAKAIFMSGGARDVEEQGIRDLRGVCF